MANPGKSAGVPSTLDTDSDRYPTFNRAMRRILEHAELPETPIERLEVNFLASGDATYRYWEPRAEESDGGYIPPE
jgi:hypothetical protein